MMGFISKERMTPQETEVSDEDLTSKKGKKDNSINTVNYLSLVYITSACMNTPKSTHFIH